MTIKSLVRAAAGAGVLSLLGACANVQQVPMKTETWAQTDRSVTVALAKLPETAAHKVGAQGLLDVAINNAMADDLTNALRVITLDNSYGQARTEVVRRLQEKGIKSNFTDKMIDVASLQDFSNTDNSRTFAAKDFRAMKTELGGADRLLLFTVVAVGTQRSYYGFVPISSPVALLRARGELIDLQTNEVLWRDNTSNTAPITDPWDQPPEFQNVSAAVQKVILEARGAMIAKLFGDSASATATATAPVAATAAATTAVAATAAAPSAISATAAATKSVSPFVGTWEGKWADVRDHTLVVESGEGTSMRLRFTWGPGKQPWFRDQGTYDVVGTVGDDGSLRAVLKDGSKVAYRLSGDRRSLSGQWQRPQRTLEGVFALHATP